MIWLTQIIAADVYYNLQLNILFIWIQIAVLPQYPFVMPRIAIFEFLQH